ncbi:helix-turn-helix domain-containing protein [Nocardia sp. NPDC049526]|uniref:helix-turn-helix domain-containing protein n=1 Tax=Nocardia sp. NPDC049526 TaxID=3364316 RepID=UPI0037B78BA3
MDGSWSLNPVVELRNSFEGLPAVVRRPIEMVVFGGELPRADISGMRRMAAEFRAKAAALSDHSEEAKELLVQEDSLGVLGERLRETLGLHRDGAARLGDDALALADQVQAAANDAEKTLCVMFIFGIELAWRIFGVLSAAAAAGPAGEVAAMPVAESMLVEGRASVAAMRAGLDQAFRAGATRTTARLSALGALRLPVTLGKAAALPVSVDAGVQALQVVSGDRTRAVIEPDGVNPTGIDLTSIKVAALSGAGGAVGGMVAGRVAPKVFPRIEGSRLVLGLMHGTAGAVTGLGAASLVTGWPEHFDHVLAPLLNGGFAGAVHAHAAARPGSGAVPDGGGAFTRPDLPAARSEETAARALPPVEVSAESQQAWAAAKAAWAAAPDTVAAGGERADVSAAGGHGNSTPVKSGESRSPAASASTPHNDATGRAPARLDSAAGSAGRSETGAPVAGPHRGESVPRTNATAPRPVEAGGETSAPPKVSTSTPARQVSSGPETATAGEHRSPGNHEHGNTGKVSAATDETRHETPGDARPAPSTGDRPETPAAGEHLLPGNEEHAPADNAVHAPEGERSVLVGETGDEVSGDPGADSVDSAGSPAPSAHEQAVELLADFHASSGDHIPEQLRLCNLPDEVLKAGLFDDDARKSMIATTEIIRRGTISDALPAGMVLRVEQAEGVYALDKRPVEMKPGEGKSLMFMAAAMQRAVRHGECLLVTTTDGLAHREFTKYGQLLTDFGIDVFRADQQQGFGPVTDGRPAIVVATGETVGHLCNAGHRPPRHALIDEMDGIIDRGERQFLRSEGAEQVAPEATAREVFAAHDFLADALEKGALSHEDFGLTRIIEEVGLYQDGTPEVQFWYDGHAELTPEGRAKVEALPGGKQWLDGPGSARLETAAAAEFTTRNKTHYVMDAGKIVIVDQGEHGLQRNPVTSSESRWSAEPGKASLAQAVEAKEIRAAEAIGMSPEQHQIVVRADADSAKTINAVEIYRKGQFFDEVTGASGTLADLNPVLEQIYGLDQAHQVGRSQTHRLIEGAPEVVANTRIKLDTIAAYAHRMWDAGRGRFQEILCHRNDLVDRQVAALVREGVPREVIEAVDADRIAGWGADWEAELQKIFDDAGEQGKILVINRQGQRGVDISVSEAVQAKGGMHVWMTEVPEQSYVHEQATNRTARNGARGFAQTLVSPQDALIRNAMHLHGVREAVVHYDQATAAHRTDPTPENHNNLVEAGHKLRSLVPELQERALRHATADFLRHYAHTTVNPAAALAAAETRWYSGPAGTDQPDQVSDQATRLAGLLGIPPPAVTSAAAVLDHDDADGPPAAGQATSAAIPRLLEQAGLPPAAVEALRQQVEATAPATIAQHAALHQQTLDQLVERRGRLADTLGPIVTNIEDIDGAEGMRNIYPVLTEARDDLAKALGYPASAITPAIARDILGEAVGYYLPAGGTHQPDAAGHEAAREDADRISANPVQVDPVAENPVAAEIVAAASHYLAAAALLDLVVAIHRRSPNSCVNNAVTGVRVLTRRNIEMPSYELAGHGRETLTRVFGAPLVKAESLDHVAESLNARPGGIASLVYKWKDSVADTKDKDVADAEAHMVLVVNDSEPGEAPNLVVVDLAASRSGDAGADYGPKDLRNRRALLDKAVPFGTWREEQERKFLWKLGDKQSFETIDLDRDGNPVAKFGGDATAAETLPRFQRITVDAEMVQEIDSILQDRPTSRDGTPDLSSRADAGMSDESRIPVAPELARIGSRPHDTPDPAEPALETAQEHETSPAAPEALLLALAVVDSFQSGPDITQDAQRFVTKCYEEYRQQEQAALPEQRWTAPANEHGMTSEEAEQAAMEYAGSAAAPRAVDDAAARRAAALVSDMARYADRVQISLPGSLADLYRAEANTANARKLQQAFALIDRVESSPDTTRDAKRFVMSCYEEYRQKREEAAFQRQRRTALVDLTPEEAEQQAREFVGRADIRADIDSAAATDTRRLIHNIQGKWTKTSLPLSDTLARLYQAEATTASARKLATSMKADTGDTRAPGDQVGSRPHQSIADSKPRADAPGDRQGPWGEFTAAIPTLVTAGTERWAAQGNSPDFRWLASQLGPLARHFSTVGAVALRLVGDESFADLLPLWRRFGELGAAFESQGCGEWYVRNLYQLMEWLVDYALVGEYRNSYEVVDSVNDRGVYVGVTSEVNRAGIIRNIIVTAEGTPRGGVMFADGWGEVGDIVHGIEGFWVQNNMMLGDNLTTFNAGIRENLSPEDAARATFTGKMAYRRGFTEVVIGETDGDPGYFEKAVVTFVRPSRLSEMRCRVGGRLMGISLPEMLDRAGWSSEIADLRDEAAQKSAEIDRQVFRPSPTERPADWSGRRAEVETRIAEVERLAESVAQWWAEQDARDHSAIATVTADVLRRNPGARQVTPNTVLLPGYTVVVIAEDGRHDDAVTDMLLHNLELRSELRSTGYGIRQLKPIVEQDDSGNPRVRSENLGTVHINAKLRMPDDHDLARRRRDEQVYSLFRSLIANGVNRDVSSAAYLRMDWPQRAALVRQRRDLTSQLRGIPARWRNRAGRYRLAQELARLRESRSNLDDAGRRRLAHLETIGAVLARADERADRMSGQPEVYLWAFDPDTGYLVLTMGDPDLVPDVDDITDQHIVDSGTVDLLGADVDGVVDDFASDRQLEPGRRRSVVIFVAGETDSDAGHRRLADLTDITATRKFYQDKVADSATDGSALVRLLEGDRRDTVSEMLWLVKYLMPDHPVRLVEATAGPDFPVGAPGEELAARVGADWSAVFRRPEDVATHLAGRPGTFALLAVENPARDYGSGVDLVMVRNDGDDRLVQIDLNQVNPDSVEPGDTARAALTRDWPPYYPADWTGKWDKGFGIGLGPEGPERPLVDGESTGVRGEDFPDGLIGARPTEGGSGSAYERYRHRTEQYHGVTGNWLNAMVGEPLSTVLLRPGSPVLLDWATRQVVDRHRLAELLRLRPDEPAADSRRRQVWAQLNQRRILANPTDNDLYVDELMGWTSIGDAHRHAPGVVHSAAERFVVSRGVLESADRVALLAWRLGCLDELSGQLRFDEQRSAIMRRVEPADRAARTRKTLANRLEALTAELEVHENALDAIDTADLQMACDFQGLVWFDVRPGSTSRIRLDRLLEVATAELRAAVGRDPAQLSKQELDGYEHFSDDGNIRRWAKAFRELTMIADVTDQAHHHETRLATLTELLDNELAQVFGTPPITLVPRGPSGQDIIDLLGQRFPGVRSPAADALARHVDATGVERFLMVKEVFRDGWRGVWRLPSALEAAALDVRAAGPSTITESGMVVVDASEQSVAQVDGRYITDVRWLTRGELEFADANRMVHGWFQENFSSALGAFDPVVPPTGAARELARFGSRLSLSTDDIEVLVRRLTGRPADEHTRIVHFFHLLTDEFERDKILAELNADLGGGDLLDLHLHRLQTQIGLAASPELVDVISTPMAPSILLDMVNSSHWSGDTIGAGVEFLASPEIGDALRKIYENNSHFESDVRRRMSKQVATDLDAVGRELRRVAEIPAGTVDLRLLTMFDGFVTKNPPGKDRAWDVLASLDDFSPDSVRRKFADVFLRTRQIANIPDDVRAEVTFTAQQLRDVEDLYIRGPSGREFACYVEMVGELPVGRRPPTIRAAMEFVRDVTPEFARCLRDVLADGADGAERSALGLQRSGEAVLGELKDIARSFVADVKGAVLSAESLAKVQTSDFLARLLIDVTHYESSDWGHHDIASLRELLRHYHEAGVQGRIAPMADAYRPSGVVEVVELRTRDRQSGPQWTEDLLTRFARLAKNLQDARSALTGTRRPITHLLDKLGRDIADHTGTLENSIASGRLADGSPMNDVARRNMLARAQELKQLIATKDEAANKFPALRSLEDFENNFQRLARVGELHDDLRTICFSWAMQQHPEWVDRLKYIGAGEPTLRDVTIVREFVEHITNQEVFAQYFSHRRGAQIFRRMTSVAALDEAIARTQGVGVSSDTTRLRFVPTRGPLLELSGHIASACWAGRYRSIAEVMPNMTAVIMVRNPDDTARTALAGAALLIETTSASGEPLLLIRGLNPLETYINHVSVADFYSEFADWAHGIAADLGRRLAIVIDGHCGGAATNRPALYGYLAEARPELTPIRVDPSDTIFNGYDVSECAYLVGPTSTRDKQQHREPGGRIGSRPSENPGDRPGGWMSEPGRPGDVAADGSADDLLSPASRPLPVEVIGREIDEVTEILGSRVPPEQLADPEVRRGVRLVAEGLYINRRLYGRADTGRADDIHDAAVELREPGAANRYGDGMRVAADLRRVLDNGVLQGADLGEIMAAMIADAWSDLAGGGGRHGGNPQLRATVRSAELLHARALAHGCAPSTARVLGFAVSGIGFDARTGTQTIASPTAIDEMRQRLGEITGGEFETAMRVARWVAAAGLQTLSEPDAVVGWVQSDRGNDVGERQALIDRLRDRAGFVDPDSGYRPPEGWLLANRDMRRDHAAKAREIADRLASDPGYTPVDAYRDSRLHAAEMREEHSGFGWQLVIGPGTDASDPGTLADAVAARLPESGSARARKGNIDAIARLAELTLPRARADAVLVVTSSEEADGRRRLLAELDYSRPDATDPAPGVTAEELRRELSDVDGRIDVDSAAPLPKGQVRHQVRLDLTRQRILVCCSVWGRGWTGLSTVNWALCRGLAAAGHEVIVSAGQIARGSRLSGVKVYGDRDRVSGASRWKRFDGGPDDLPWSVDLVIVHAEDDGLTAALEARTRYPAARLVSVHHLTPMLWETLMYSPENGRAEIAARIFLARRAHLVTGLGPVLATDALSAAVMAGHGSVHQLQPGLEVAEQPPEPAPGDPAWILLFGRVDDELKGAAETAEVVRRLRAQGRDVRLMVRGYPKHSVEAARAKLARLAGGADAVEVRPHTASRRKLRDDIRAATIVVMPSRAEGFGGVATEAIEQGVPVAVSSSSGVGRFLAELGDYRDLAERFNLVEQPLGAQVPIDNWVAGLGSVLDDLPGAWAAARELQGLMRPYTRENSARMLVHAARNTDPHARPEIGQLRTQVSFESGSLVARGEEEDYLRILAVADAMETDRTVRAAVLAGAGVVFASAQDPRSIRLAAADADEWMFSSLRTAVPQDDSLSSILRAFVATVSDQGFSATTVEDVCHRARISSATFHHYFRSTDSAFRTAHHEALTDLRNMVDEEVRGAAQDLAARIAVAVNTYVSALAARPATARMLLVEGVALDPAVRADVMADVTVVIADTVATVRNETTVFTPERRALAAAVHGTLADWVATGDDAAVPRLRSGLAALFRNGTTTLAAQSTAAEVDVAQLHQQRVVPFERSKPDERERISTQLIAVAAEQGFTAMSLEEVQRRAGVSAQTYRKLFSDKETGFEAACDEALERLRTASRAAMPGIAGGDIRSRFDTAVRAYLAALAEHPNEARVLHLDLRTHRPLHDRHRMMLADHLAAAVYEIDDHTARLLAAAVQGVVTDRIISGRSTEARLLGTSDVESGRIATLPDFAPTVTSAVHGLLAEFGETTPPHDDPPDLGTGLIGSRPFEDSPGERGFAGPGFEELVLAGLESGIAERFVVEDARGVRVEEMTFDNGVRVFKETYADPVDALVQVLQTKVAIMMGAPVAHAMLNLEDDRIYRELTPGRPGDSVEVVDPEVLDSDSALRLGLFDAVTGTRRTAREWSVADNEVMGRRAGSDLDVTQTGVFASSFVRRIDGRLVWLDHAMPTWEVAAIREQVSHLDTWISNFPMPEEHRAALLDIHGEYLTALTQVERHAVHTFGEQAHRAGLDVEAQAKARLVEVFNLNYPHVTVVGFDHPDVPAHVVEEILGGLDEMFTRFPDRTNIRELRIDYTDWEATSPRTHNYADPAAAGRTLSMRFSLRDAANPAQTVERGIRFLEFGLNPVGDRPFHHNAVHEFVHAIDAVEGLSKNLQKTLSQTWGQLSNHGLIEESWWTWLTRLPRYAFVNEAKTVLNDAEALAVGFAEADIHGVAAGSPQWAIHDYVTTGQPPQVTPDLEVDLPPQEDHPDPGGLIGSRPHEDDSQTDTARGVWIKTLRLDRGMTQEQLAHAAALKKSALSNYETGHQKPSFGTFQRICRALGLEGAAISEAIRQFDPGVEPETDVAERNSPGRWITARRNAKGINKSGLARAVGVDPTSITEVENGGRPRPGLFLRIARVLGVGQQELAAAAREFYSDVDFDLDPVAYDPDARGRWIAALRHDRDMFQAELARAAGITSAYVSKIESGYIPSSIVFRRMCRALGVAPEVLDAATRRFYPDLELDLEPTAHDPEAPGSWFVALRHDRDLTAIELAKAIGVGSDLFARIENEKFVPGFTDFRRICDVLGVGDELLRAAARHFGLDVDPASHKSLGRWIATLRRDKGLSAVELGRRSRVPPSTISGIETGRYLPRLRKLRQICQVLGVDGDVLLEAVEQFYAGRFERSGYRDEEALFNRYVVSRVGSPEERAIRDEICERFAWVPNALVRCEFLDVRDEAEQAAWMGILSAIDTHIPSSSFAAHAWASGRGAVRTHRLARRFPDLDNRTRWIVRRVEAQIGRMVSASEVLDDAEIARAVRLTVADVVLAREILARPTLQLDAPITGESGSRNRELADPAASTGFSDTDFAVTVRAALGDMADPGTAERLVMLHLVQGVPLADVAARLGVPAATAAEVLTDSVVRLRNVFDKRRSSGVTASGQDSVPPTPWTTMSAEPVQPPVRSGDSESGEGSPNPGGLIGSRPHEQDEPPRRRVPGQTTPWSPEVIGEPHPDDQLRRQPSDMVPEWPAGNTPGPVQLTACETEVLALVRQGMTHNEIAAALDLSVRDVRAHLASVRRKLRNQRAQLVATRRPADPPSTTSVSDRFRAAMYAAVTSADQPDPRELLAAASPEQMERAVQGLSPAHQGALRRLRAGANTPVIRSMALIAARRWVTALAAEHDRSQAVFAAALTVASPADLQTALDQLTAAERQLLVNRFGPATSPATFEPDDSVRALRAVEVVRHVAGWIATRAGMPAVDETGYDKNRLQRGHHLVEIETYTADECLDAVSDWMDRQDPPESGKRSTGSRRGSASRFRRLDGQLQQDRPPADQAGGGGPVTPGGSYPATASSEEPGRPDDDNGTGSVRAGGADDRRRSLPVDRGFDDEHRRLADEALRAGGFDDAGRLQRWGYRLTAGSARRRATENGGWWDSLSDPAAPGGLSSMQRALIRVYPHQIGNADGLPATVRDHANRLSIRRDLDELIARKPAGQRLLNWLRTELTDAERKQFSNLLHTRNHLQELDRQAAQLPGSPPVHLLAYDATAFNGKGKVVAALGNVDTAHTVNWHVPGTNTTSSSLAYQFKPLRNLYEETLRVDPSLELASIIWIGYDAPAGPVNTGYVKAAFRRRARIGGDRLLCDITAFHATRSLAGTAGPDRLVTRLYGHSYGSVVIFYAGSNGKLAYLVVTITVSGSPGAATVRHAAELGIGADNVLVAASGRDLVTILGADEPGAQSRFTSRLGHGIDPASEAFGGKRFPAEFPDSVDFAGTEAVHQGYLRYDPATGQPTEALANIAQITAGRGDTLAWVDRRQPGRWVVARPIDPERGRYADGNEPHPRSTPSSDGPPKATPWTRRK